MGGSTAPEGRPSYADFSARISAVLDQVRTGHDGDVLMISSGGPISSAVGQILSMPAVGTIELNRRSRNSAGAEFSCNPKRHVLHSFNTLPHLDSEDFASWVNYP